MTEVKATHPGDNSTKTPLVSVCIGVYNRERYIRECIDSVLAQTYKPVEIVVVDDASTDASVEILKSYGENIRLVERKENSGVCGIPRNDAIRVALGEYIAFLDSDDSWAPDKLARQMEQLQSRSDLAWNHTYAMLMDEHSHPLGIRHEGILRDDMPVFQELIKHCFITISSVVVKKDALDEVGYFTADRSMRGREDYELFLRLAARFKLGFVPEALTNYRRAASGLSYHDNYWRSTPRDVVGMSMIYRQPSYWRGLVSRKDFREMLGSACLEDAIYWRDRKRPGRSLWFIGQALKAHPLNLHIWDQGFRSLYRLITPRKA